MTVSSMAQSAQPTTLILLQKLLVPDQPSSVGHEKTSHLCNKLRTAVTALTCTPALSALSLEVVANTILSLGPLETTSPVEPPLLTALQDVWTLFDKLFSHNPKGWSIKLFRWCVNLLACVSAGNTGSLSLEDTLRRLLTHPLISPVIELLNKCSGCLVRNGCGQECMEMLLPTCSLHAPSLNWLLAHVVSLHPPELTSLLLDHTLSSPFGPAHESAFAALTKVFAHLALTHRHALRLCLVDKVRLLLGEKGCAGSENAEGRLMNLFVLLKLLTSCRALLDIVAEDILSLVTAKTMIAAVVKGSLSSPSSSKKVEDTSMSSQGDEDEGEILSDDEMEGVTTPGDTETNVTTKEVVMLVSELICQLPGKQACAAVGIAFDMYVESKGLHTAQEECIEEGEIVRESGIDLVIDAVEQLISEVLARLHAATCAPHLTPAGASSKAGPGRGLEFAVGMQEGLEMWCSGMLTLIQQKGRDSASVSWLQEVVTYIGLSCSELRVARALAFLLTHAHLPSQLPSILTIFKDIQARHFSLAHSTLQHCITSIQQPLPSFSLSSSSFSSSLFRFKKADNGNLMASFASNMLMVLHRNEKDTASGFTAHHITRCQFGHGLLGQLLPLTQLLSQAVQAASSSANQLVLILDLMRSVLEQEWAGEEGGQSLSISPQSQGRVLQALLVEYFTLMRILAHAFKKEDHTHLGLEVALGKFLWLISWCTKAPSSKLTTEAGEENSSIISFAKNARVMAYNLVVETVLSDTMSGFFTTSSSLTHRHTPSSTSSFSLSHSNLLGNYSSLPAQLSPSSLSDRRESLAHTKRGQRDVASPQLDSQSSISLSAHLTRLLLAIGSSSSSPYQAQKELAMVVLDCVAPQFLAELRQWPDEEALKYSQERDLNIKRMFDDHPVLWSFLQFISDPLSSNEPSALIACATIIRSLLTVLTQHWQRCCVNTATTFPWELENTTVLLECIAKALWIHPPLAYVGDLLPQLSPSEITSLLTAVNTFIKLNFDSIKSGHQPETPDKNCCDLVKGIVLHHMQHFGHLYERFVNQDKN